MLRPILRAKELGINTTDDMKALIGNPKASLIIELTGNQNVLENVKSMLRAKQTYYFI